MAVNEIGDEGTKAVSEILKKNTTLISLDLACEGKRKGNEKWEMLLFLAGTKIEDEGAKSLSEMIKVNTTLTSLNLLCEE